MERNAADSGFHKSVRFFGRTDDWVSFTGGLVGRLSVSGDLLLRRRPWVFGREQAPRFAERRQKRIFRAGTRFVRPRSASAEHPAAAVLFDRQKPGRTV